MSSSSDDDNPALAGWVLGVSAAIGLAAGLLIGAVGVGGIVLVPSLVQLPGIAVKEAVASCMLAYIAAGITGSLSFLAHARIHWASVLWLVLGAAPGAFAGAFTLQFLGDFAVKLTLYIFILLAALFSLWRTLSARRRPPAVAANDDDTDAANGESPHSQGQTAATGALTAIPAWARTNDHGDLGDLADLDDLGDLPSPGDLDDLGDLDTSPGSKPTSSSQVARSTSFVFTAGERLPASAHPPPARTQSSTLGGSREPLTVNGDGGSDSPAPWPPLHLRDKALRIGIGVFVGFSSALTGSSGPVTLLPILLILHWDIHDSLGSAQTIQVPIAIGSSVGFVVLTPELLDYELAGVVAAGLVPGIVAGTRAASRLPVQTLRLIIAIVLVVAAVTLLTKLIVDNV